jgi:type II secretory pathway component PulJ
MSSLFRRISAREDGFTLIELMTVSFLLMIVMVAILTSFESVQKASVRETARSDESDVVRLAMEQITKEVRQAIDVRTGSSTSFLDIDTYVEGVEKHISYTASGTTLTRTVGGVTTTMLQRLQGTDVFSYDPSVTTPSVITITLVSKPEFFNSDPALITLTSEIKIRNGGSS